MVSQDGNGLQLEKVGLYQVLLLHKTNYIEFVWFAFPWRIVCVACSFWFDT